MSAHSTPTDYFGINSTKIYSANPSGNFTVTSLPLTRRHLQDLESPSYYNLLFDLIANNFSNTPLHRRSPHLITTPAEASVGPSGRYRPGLSATKSAEAILTPLGREHQPDRGCSKCGSKHSDLADSPQWTPGPGPVPAPNLQRSPPWTPSPGHIPTPNLQRTPTVTTKARNIATTNPRRTRPPNSPYESPSRIGARSVGALRPLPEDTKHLLDHPAAVHRRPSPVRARSAEEISTRRNTILCGFQTRRLGRTASTDPILSSPAPHHHHEPPTPHSEPRPRISTRHSHSTVRLPSRAMSPEPPPQSDPDSDRDSADAFPAMANPHRTAVLSLHRPSRPSLFSLGRAKKAMQRWVSGERGERKRRERAEHAAQKMQRANKEAAQRAERRGDEGAEQMRKLSVEAWKQSGRREEQVLRMERRRRRREEDQVRVVEGQRRQRAWGGAAWGFDPGAGMREGVRVGRDGDGDGDGGGRVLGCGGLGRGSTWGVSAGGPGEGSSCAGVEGWEGGRGG